MNFKSIQSKLTFILVAFFILSFSLLSAVSYYIARDGIIYEAEEAATAISSEHAHRIQAHFDVMIVQLESLASVQWIRTGENREQIVQALNELHQRAGIYDVIFFAWPDGSAVRWNGVDANYANRDYFQTVIRTQRPFIGEVVFSVTNGNLVVPIAVPVIHEGRLTGVLAATYNLNRLSNGLSAINFGETGYAILFDSEGRVIGNPKNSETVWKLNINEKRIDPSLNLKVAELDDKLINMFRQSQTSVDKPVHGNFRYFDGQDHTSAFAPINMAGGQRWTLLVTAPTSEILHRLMVLGRAMLGIVVVFIAIAIVVIYFISRNISNPINALADAAEKIAQGDLSTEIKVSHNDEIGALQKSLKTLSTNLRALVRNVQDSADYLAASSQELTASADQSAQASNSVAISVMSVVQGTETQMLVVGQATDALVKLSSEAEQATINANTVGETSDKTAQAAERGGKAVATAINQMSFIQNTVENLAKEITILGVRSNEIGQIVETISGIAGQTNLLALNAAIEAARAGEQGRGFAVVAEEVRKLAEQSQDAAKQISELIGAIQNDTTKAVQAMEAGTKEVRTGSELVNNAGAAFKEIEELIAQSSAQIKEILESIHTISKDTQATLAGAKEVYRLSSETSGQTKGVSAATEEQLASMEEIASASQALAKLAEELQVIVRKFRL